MTSRNIAGRKIAGLGGAAGSATLVLAVLLACGCSSSAAASPAAAGSATESTCQQVSAVLSDGPDPDADPVGYAEAQILPLRQIRSANPALRGAIGELADAYQQVFSSDGKSSNAKETVVVASKKLNSICPGAAS
jgi:hypothetical protein